MKLFILIKKLFRGVFNRATTVFTLSFLYPYIYKKYAKEKIEEDKVIFLVTRLPNLTDSFHQLYDKLYTETDFELKCHFLRNGYVTKSEYIKRCCSFIADSATAKYIFLDEGTHVTGKISIRPETVVTQLWHGCGAFKKFGLSTAEYKFGANKKTMQKYPAYKNYTNITVSSPEVVRHFEEAMGYENKKGTVKAIGVSRTDVFFDNEFIKKAYEEVYKLCPEAKNKKIILYAPTFRGNVENATAPDKLDIKLLCQMLSEKYILIIKNHPLVSKHIITDKLRYDSFAFDLSAKISVDKLMCVSDICISDYSSLVFEYALFEKPMIFFAYDLEEYFDERGFYYSYNELMPGPVFSKTSEIADYISNIESEFDKNRIIQYKEKFMSSCDGNSTDRICETVFKENYKIYAKKVPLLRGNYHLIPSADNN